MKKRVLLLSLLGLLCCLTLSASALNSDSVYNLDSKWVNQDGKAVQLKDYRGRPVIIAMVYLTCKFLCPTIISDVQRVEAKLSGKAKERIQVILVSFDPDRDTPEKMRAFGVKRGLDFKHWSLITQKDESNLRELAGVLGFKYQKQEGGTEFSHAFLITVLDSEGLIKASLEGANKDVAPFVAEVEKLK